jgi:hypothetical protein
MAKKTKFQPGTWIEREMFESKAYINLKGFAPQLLILFLAKRRFEYVGRKGKEKRVCVNHDQLVFTYIEAEKKYGVSKPRFSRALAQLLAKGFIILVNHGGTYRQDKSLYGLSDKWMLWQPGTVFEKREKSKVARGYCKPKKQK